MSVWRAAPAFTAECLTPAGTFSTISLSDYRGKYLLLFFYPSDFTFVCPTEVSRFSDRAHDFAALGCEVVGCSVDSKYAHLAWTKKARSDGGVGPVQISLIGDVTRDLCRAYGVLGDEHVALRGAFLIDPAQTVRSVSIGDFPVGRNVDALLDTLRAVQTPATVTQLGAKRMLVAAPIQAKRLRMDHFCSVESFNQPMELDA